MSNRIDDAYSLAMHLGEQGIKHARLDKATRLLMAKTADITQQQNLMVLTSVEAQ